MKKFLLFFITLYSLFFVRETFAQQNLDFLYGLKFGMNFANFGGSDGTDFRNATGLNLGGIVRKYTNDNMFFQLELLISEKGALDNQDVDTVNVEVTWFLNYFEVPILLGYDFGGFGNSAIHPVLTGGGFLAIKTSSKLRGDFNNTYTEIDYTDAKSFDYGFVLGGAVEFEVQESKLILDVRYTKSLTTFDNSTQNWDFKNNVITASIGFIF